MQLDNRSAEVTDIGAIVWKLTKLEVLFWAPKQLRNALAQLCVQNEVFTSVSMLSDEEPEDLN